MLGLLYYLISQHLCLFAVLLYLLLFVLAVAVSHLLLRYLLFLLLVCGSVGSSEAFRLHHSYGQQVFFFFETQ